MTSALYKRAIMGSMRLLGKLSVLSSIQFRVVRNIATSVPRNEGLFTQEHKELQNSMKKVRWKIDLPY